MSAVDMTGLVISRLTVVSRAPNSWQGNAQWNCVCACGMSVVVTGGNLRAGSTKSCGCLIRELRAGGYPQHAMCDSKEYSSYHSMKQRCCNPSNDAYSYYGGRGIVICSRWLESFENFFEDMGPIPGDGFSIDRIDNNGNYEPKNCKWATKLEQSQNTRATRNITIGGASHCISEWSRLVGLSLPAIYDRVKRGMSWQEAITTPRMGR